MSFRGFGWNQTKINDQAVPVQDEIQFWYKLLLYAIFFGCTECAAALF